ncbi:hypothetical protein N0V82_007563 [Gnomoniopsis sp. IMI 355080]|nr:hypothetical protein N0V82_007563 [Gnomoniopsis sp. IMI 355080]
MLGFLTETIRRRQDDGADDEEFDSRELLGDLLNLTDAQLTPDAAGFSKATGPGGGADGSLVLAPEEILRPENGGLQDSVDFTMELFGKWKSYGITMADLVQFSAQVAVVVCPLGPRSRTFSGRVDSSTACPDGLLPPASGSAAYNIELFRNKTIEPHGLTALIGAHTTSQQFFVDTDRAGDPQDSTPGIWDVLFYRQVLDGAPPRVFDFESDINLSKAPETQGEFLKFANDSQEDWNEDFAREYIRLSLLSVYNINEMAECTKVLPQALKTYTEPDEDLLEKWRNSDQNFPLVAEAIFNGSVVTPDLFSNVSNEA